MINGKSVLAVIPARGGSKGVPRKNLRELAGKPLLAWSIEQAARSAYIDRLILSSEDEEIIAVAEKWGCEVPFVRPRDLARDDSLAVDVVLHAIAALPEKYDYLLFLQPTSPLRRTEDIDGCVEYAVRKNAPCCVSVTVPDKSPFWMFTMGEDKRIKPILKLESISTSRQKLPKVYELNGAIYFTLVDWFIESRTFISDETIGYLMPKENSLDIDTELDLKFIQMLMQENRDKSRS